jgi:hypothetical protein
LRGNGGAGFAARIDRDGRILSTTTPDNVAAFWAEVLEPSRLTPPAALARDEHRPLGADSHGLLPS